MGETRASRSASWLRSAWSRLRGGWQLVAELTLAATASWFVASRLLGGPHGSDDSAAFYAPAAALIVLAQARGVRLRQAIRVLAGIAVGVILGEVVIWALGARSTAAIFVVILAAAGVSIAAGAPGVVRNQLTTSALFLVAVVPPNHELEPTRLYDALIGGSIALLITQVAGARSPLGPLDTEGRRAFAELAGVLADIRRAVRRHDGAAAEAALGRARQMDARTDALRKAVLVADENLRLAIWARHSRPRVDAARAAVDQLDYAVRNTRTLARSAVVLTHLPDPPPGQLDPALAALEQLTSCAAAVLAAVVAGESDAVDRHTGRAKEVALDTVRAMSPLLRHEQPLPVSTIIGQIRMVVVDLLRSARADDPDALDAIDRALDLPTAHRGR
ncbi:FUSC family protein [Micromonospora sp. NPDC049048]|uniref:FUSC family protein n=1 Tax=Micromonospora sp. NPDC049048 TaxID=3364263 RepID=UPI003714F6BA